MEPRIVTFSEKKLIGKRITMSVANNKTDELWQSFMPRRKEVQNNIDEKLYSIELYSPLYFDVFNPEREFEKWAAVEVSDFKTIPDDMDTMIIPAGLYAVFTHKGPASNGPTTYKYIFEIWLPKSEYVVDARPHFSVMGEKYKQEDPTSEEEIWIPVKEKSKTAN